MTTHITFWQYILTALLACWTVGFAFTLSWCAACYITPLLTPSLKRLFDWAVSIDSKVKSLSERLKSNDKASIEAEAKVKQLRRAKSC